MSVRSTLTRASVLVAAGLAAALALSACGSSSDPLASSHQCRATSAGGVRLRFGRRRRADRHRVRQLPGERTDRQHLRRGAQGQGRRCLDQPEHRQPRGLPQGPAGRVDRPGPGVHRSPAAVLRHRPPPPVSPDDVYAALVKATSRSGLKVLDEVRRRGQGRRRRHQGDGGREQPEEHRRPGAGGLHLRARWAAGVGDPARRRPGTARRSTA